VEISAAIPSDDEARQIALLARSISVSDAEIFSRQCFARAAAARSPAPAERCVLFDTAFLYWRKAPRSSAGFPIYFEDELVRVRHLEVLAPFGIAADARLQALRQSALRALIGQVKAETPPPAPLENLTSESRPATGSATRADRGGEDTLVP
jgi:hypothetical protein